MKKIATILYLFLLIMTVIACGRENSKTPAEQGNEHQDQAVEKSGVEDTRIKITIGDQELIAVMEDSPTTRSFLSKLPATVNFRDFAGGEKIGDAPSGVSTENAPDGYDPKLGDIAYYEPWNNVAIMYTDRPYASGLIPMGRIESGVESLKNMDGDFNAVITKDK